MHEVKVHLAQPITRPVEALTIHADVSLPTGDTSTDRMERDAEVLAKALTAHLPGGTLDRLLVLLMQQAASRLVVRHKI